MMKYAILKISPYVFINLCKKGMIKIKVLENAIPEDAHYIRGFCEESSGWGYVNLVLESESFRELNEGDEIPVLPYPMFERIE
jgi:hypothetical protein